MVSNILEETKNYKIELPAGYNFESFYKDISFLTNNKVGHSIDSICTKQKEKEKICNQMEKYSNHFKWATKLYTLPIRTKIINLYNFVRIADNWIDWRPNFNREFFQIEFENGYLEQIKAYYAFKNIYLFCKSNKYVSSGIVEIDSMVKLSQEIDPTNELMQAFFDSMEMDIVGFDSKFLSKMTKSGVTDVKLQFDFQIKSRSYLSIKDLEEYTYGSAGTIGIMCSRILGNFKDTEAAANLGLGYQLINFIRDAGEDAKYLHRCYIPESILEKHGINKEEAIYQLSQGMSENLNLAIKEMQNLYRSHVIKAQKSIANLNKFGKRNILAVMTATILYKKIDKKIDQLLKTQNPKLMHIGTNAFEKICAFIEAIFRVITNNYKVYSNNDKR